MHPSIGYNIHRMAKNQDEIVDDNDTEDVEDEDEDEDEEDEADDADESDSADDEDAEDSDDDDSSEDDEEAPLPKTRKEFDAAVAKAAAKAVKASRNRDGAAQRTSKKGKISDRERGSSKNDERLESIEQNQVKLQKLEAKRQFGYETGLAPDEVNVVFKLTKKPTKKSLADPIIKGALEGYRSDKRARANVPGSGSGRPTKVSAREEKNMTPQERRSRFEDKRRGYLAGKK